MSSERDTFNGWTALDADAAKGNLEWRPFKPKTFQEDDIEIKVLYCGVCSTDIHYMASNWQPTSYPLVAGHEMIGEVVRVGTAAKHRVGEIVAIGPMCDSCQACQRCQDGQENYCDQIPVATYGAAFNRGPSAGEKTNGGFSDYWRGPDHWAFTVPTGMDLASTAPLLCAGSTMYPSLVKYGAGTTAKNVGIVGLGGLGHVGVLFAKAMGANITVISRGSDKAQDAKDLGAENLIALGDDPVAACGAHRRSLDLIICTSYQKNLPVDALVSLLKPGGTFVLVGISGDATIALNPWGIMLSNAHFTSNTPCPPSGVLQMLDFARKHDIKPWIETFSMDEINKVVPKMDKGEARYRYVLVNTANGAK